MFFCEAHKRAVIDSTSASNVVPPLECCGCTRCKPQQHFFHFQISPQQHLKMDATSSQPGMSAPCGHHATLMIECGVGLAARRSHPSLGWVGMFSLRQHRSSQVGMTYATRFLIQNVINFKCTCLLCIASTGCTIFCMGGMLNVGQRGPSQPSWDDPHHSQSWPMFVAKQFNLMVQYIFSPFLTKKSSQTGMTCGAPLHTWVHPRLG